jgi:hypothetical protein
MLALGLILALLSAGALVAVLSSGTDDTAALYGGAVELPTLVVFLLGAAALLVFIIGLELARSGIRRANENRKTKKRLRTLEKREEQRTEPGAASDPHADTTRTAPPADPADPARSTATGSDPGSPPSATR